MRKQIVNPESKRYNDSAKVSADRQMVRRNTAARVDLIGRLNDARQARDFEKMLDIAAEYEWRGGYGDADRARKIRKEVKGMR